MVLFWLENSISPTPKNKNKTIKFKISPDVGQILPRWFQKSFALFEYIKREKKSSCTLTLLRKRFRGIDALRSGRPALAWFFSFIIVSFSPGFFFLYFFLSFLINTGLVRWPYPRLPNEYAFSKTDRLPPCLPRE